VKINKNPYSAEYAQPGRGRIEIVTKTGSAKYHGSLDFGLRDFRLDARNAFATTRPPERRTQVDANISGPLVKDDKNTFSLTASRTQDDLEPIVYAFGPGGPIQEYTSQSQTSTYFSTQLTRRIDKNALSFRYTYFDWSNKGQGSGGFVLPETASQSTSHYHELYSSYQTVISPQSLNEFFVRVRSEDSATGSLLPGVPKIVVTGAFTTGGAQLDAAGTENRLEFTDMLTWSHGRHLLKAGVNLPALGRIGSTDRSDYEGTFYFSSLDDYARHRPYSFQQQSGAGHLVFWQKQTAGFVQDEVKLRPNLSLAGGLRYEWENYGADYHNFAPRLSLAYGLGKGMKTVFRAGAGFFYDTVPAAEVGEMLLLDPGRLHQIQILNPSYPNPFSGIPSLAAFPPNMVRFSPTFKSPYTFQYSLGVERELRKSLALTATYTAMRGVDLYRSRNVNAPLPPYYVLPPDRSRGVFQQLESSGGLKGQELQATLRGSLSRFFKGMVMYELSHTMSDTDGIGSFPANSWDLQGEWSRASFDVRQFVYLYGTLNAGRFFKFGVIFSANSGKPYTMTTGLDNYHDGMTNARPPGIPRNSLQSTGAATLDLRWSREFPVHSSDKKGLRLVTGVDAFNLFNRVNYTAFVGDLKSPFFGNPVSAAPPRRIQISVSSRF
jgi:outer membrane receptor protein involved in Fe transport